MRPFFVTFYFLIQISSMWAIDSQSGEQKIIRLDTINLYSNQALECGFWKPSQISQSLLGLANAMNNIIDWEGVDPTCRQSMSFLNLENAAGDVRSYEQIIEALEKKQRDGNFYSDVDYYQKVKNLKTQIADKVFVNLSNIFGNHPCNRYLRLPDLFNNQGAMAQLMNLYTFGLSFIEPTAYAEQHFKNQSEFYDFQRFKISIDGRAPIDANSLLDPNKTGGQKSLEAYQEFARVGTLLQNPELVASSNDYINRMRAIDVAEYASFTTTRSQSMASLDRLYGEYPQKFISIINLGYDIYQRFTAYQTDLPLEKWKIFEETCMIVQLLSLIKKITHLYETFKHNELDIRAREKETHLNILNTEVFMLKVEAAHKIHWNNIQLILEMIDLKKKVAQITNQFDSVYISTNSVNMLTQFLNGISGDSVFNWKLKNGLKNTFLFRVASVICPISQAKCKGLMSKNEFLLFLIQYKYLLGCELSNIEDRGENSAWKNLDSCVLRSDMENKNRQEIAINFMADFKNKLKKIEQILSFEIITYRESLRASNKSYKKKFEEYNLISADNENLKKTRQLLEILPSENELLTISQNWIKKAQFSDEPLRTIWQKKMVATWNFIMGDSGLDQARDNLEGLKSFVSNKDWWQHQEEYQPLLGRFWLFPDFDRPSSRAVEEILGIFYPSVNTFFFNKDNGDENILIYSDNKPGYCEYQKIRSKDSSFETHQKIINFITSVDGENKKLKKNEIFLQKAQLVEQIFDYSLGWSANLYVLCETMASLNSWMPPGHILSLFDESSEGKFLSERCGSVGEQKYVDHFKNIPEIANFAYPLEKNKEYRKNFINQVAERIIRRENGYKKFTSRFLTMLMENPFTKVIKTCANPMKEKKCVLASGKKYNLCSGGI